MATSVRMASVCPEYNSLIQINLPLRCKHAMRNVFLKCLGPFRLTVSRTDVYGNANGQQKILLFCLLYLLWLNSRYYKPEIQELGAREYVAWFYALKFLTLMIWIFNMIGPCIMQNIACTCKICSWNVLNAFIIILCFQFVKCGNNAYNEYY